MSCKQNLHIHTTYVDGKDAPEEIVLAAIKKGFDSIGFSEHTYTQFSDYPYQMTVPAQANYQKEVLTLKEKYKNQIEIFCGLEYEMFSSVPTDGFDYLIGSVHYIDIDGKKYGFDRGVKEAKAFVRDLFGGDGMAFAKRYFENVSQLPSYQKFDIIGHFDILVKTNDTLNFVDTSAKQYLNYGFEAIHALKGKIPLFEINSGAIARGYKKAPYPQMDFLKEFKNCGFGVVITSDCHDKNFIDCYYNESKEILKAAGFNTHFILTNNGFVEEKI